MAKKLNKSRIRDSKIFVVFAVFLIVFAKALIPYETATHETLEFIGYLLVALCALGRVYTSAFLGGFKNDKLITYGPFSIVRNPLYFFSLVGFAGIALITAHIVIIVGLPVAFIITYHFLIKREEERLQEIFGASYKKYKAKTPKLFPNFKLYKAPEIIEVKPKFLNNAFRDSIWWFAAFPLLEILESLKGMDIFPSLFILP